MTICQYESLGTYFDYPLTGLANGEVGFYIRKILKGKILWQQKATKDRLE